MNINAKSEYIGKEFPSQVTYFKLEGINHNICLPNEKPDIDKTCEIYVNPRVHNLKLVKTDVGLSNEGKYLTGYKLISEIVLDEKIMYASDEINQSIFAVQYETLKSVCIVLPTHINDKRIEELYKCDLLLYKGKRGFTTKVA